MPNVHLQLVSIQKQRVGAQARICIGVVGDMLFLCAKLIDLPSVSQALDLWVGHWFSPNGRLLKQRKAGGIQGFLPCQHDSGSGSVQRQLLPGPSLQLLLLVEGLHTAGGAGPVWQGGWMRKQIGRLIVELGISLGLEVNWTDSLA